ncbi:MAG: Hsp70 family protein [Deltaproteobacteria bacterium]|nr:Hsp70 family protein [Deltaproteobacteria bacterium]
MGVAVGIDLGTSNSCVAAVRDGEPVVFADAEGRRTQPSVVAFGYGKSAVVGHRARRQILYAPEHTVVSAKRLIGRRADSEEVRRMKAQSAFGITEGENGDVRIRVQGRLISAPEVSAHVLMHMKKIAEAALDEDVDKAVITVPAYFNDAQRQATRDAASIAGLECLRIINEPTAAALAYGFRQGKRQHVAVYDLGGGTFDISVLRIDDDFFEVVATAGDTFLGGDDFDYAAADQFLDKFCRQTGLNLADNRTVRMKLREAAERAKIALSTADEVQVQVPALHRGPDGKQHDFTALVDRFTYAQWVMPLVQRTFDVCDDALKAASMTTRQVDHVLLVGGMTRFPLVRDAVQQFFGKSPNASLNPDEVVAVGAAIQAHALTNVGEAASSVLLDVTPQSLGVRTVGGFVEVVIPRNTAIPTDSSKVFHTALDSQTEVRIAVFQGESRMAADNELLGEFVLEGLTPRPRGQVKVRVTFEIDNDGIVHVRALDDSLGIENSIRIEAKSGLAPEEIKAARFDDVDF